MENSRKGKISEEKYLDPSVGVQVDVQGADRSQRSIEGVSPSGPSTNAQEQSDVIDQLFLRLDMRAALPQGARSPKSRGAKAGAGGKGTALRHKVPAFRQAPSIRKKKRKTASRKRNTTKFDFLGK
jgi:hypothetical protein